MADTFTTIWNRLLLRAPAVGAALAQDMVRDAFQQLAERREWSWLIKSGAFFPPSYPWPGSISVTPGSNILTGLGTNFISDMIGKQFRPGAPPSMYPTYTILEVLSTTSILLDQPWVGPTLSGAQYQIFQCYFPVPADFNYWSTIVNVTNNYKLWTNLMQSELDLADPQRVQQGITYAAAFYDYTQNFLGTVGPSLQVRGSGPSPLSTESSNYTYPADSVFVIEITATGVTGVAQFKWKQDSGAYTLAVNTSATPIDLAYGVQVYFPLGVTYETGDVFIIQATAEAVTGVPRYELWPRPINTPYVYPYLYVSKHPALTDEQPQLPLLIAQRGDVLLEMALAKCAQYPGTDTTRNPYFNLTLYQQHALRAETMLYELEKKDDDLAIKDLKYQNLPYYPAPWVDGSWLQVHAIYPNP